jgi:hypothetical protein
VKAMPKLSTTFPRLHRFLGKSKNSDSHPQTAVSHLAAGESPAQEPPAELDFATTAIQCFKSLVEVVKEQSHLEEDIDILIAHSITVLQDVASGQLPWSDKLNDIRLVACTEPKLLLVVEEKSLQRRYKEVMRYVHDTPFIIEVSRPVDNSDHNKLLVAGLRRYRLGVVTMLGDKSIYLNPKNGSLNPSRGSRILSMVKQLETIKLDEGGELRKKWLEILDKERIVECFLQQMADVLRPIEEAAFLRSIEQGQ